MSRDAAPASLHQGVNMADIEILHIGSKEYITFEDAAHYLGCAVEQVKDYIYLERLRADQVESRWLVDWASLKALAEKRGQKRRVS